MGFGWPSSPVAFHEIGFIDWLYSGAGLHGWGHGIGIPSGGNGIYTIIVGI